MSPANNIFTHLQTKHFLFSLLILFFFIFLPKPQPTYAQATVGQCCVDPPSTPYCTGSLTCDFSGNNTANCLPSQGICVRPTLPESPPEVGQGACCGGYQSVGTCQAPYVCNYSHPNANNQCERSNSEGICDQPKPEHVGFNLPRYKNLGPEYKNFKFANALIWGPQVISQITTNLLPYIYAIAGLLLFGYLLYGGFHLASSFGSPKAILEAWQIIFRALVGFALVFSTFWLLRLIETIFGLCILGNCA